MVRAKQSEPKKKLIMVTNHWHPTLAPKSADVPRGSQLLTPHILTVSHGRASQSQSNPLVNFLAKPSDCDCGPSFDVSDCHQVVLVLESCTGLYRTHGVWGRGKNREAHVYCKGIVRLREAANSISTSVRLILVFS